MVGLESYGAIYRHIGSVVYITHREIKPGSNAQEEIPGGMISMDGADYEIRDIRFCAGYVKTEI